MVLSRTHNFPWGGTPWPSRPRTTLKELPQFEQKFLNASYSGKRGDYISESAELTRERKGIFWSGNWCKPYEIGISYLLSRFRMKYNTVLVRRPDSAAEYNTRSFAATLAEKVLGVADIEIDSVRLQRIKIQRANPAKIQRGKSALKSESMWFRSWFKQTC